MCPTCRDTIADMFASDLAASKAVIGAEKAGLASPNLSTYPWSIRTRQLFESGETKDIIEQYMSRLDQAGLEFACDNAGYSSLCVNLGFTETPANYGACNENVCNPEHWVQLRTCDLANDVCEIVSYGAVESHPCSLLGNFTVAIVAAYDGESNSDGDVAVGDAEPAVASSSHWLTCSFSVMSSFAAAVLLTVWMRFW